MALVRRMASSVVLVIRAPSRCARRVAPMTLKPPGLAEVF